MVIDSPWLRLYIVLEYSRSPSTQDDYSSYRWCQQHTGTVLMDYLLVGVNIDRQAVWCVHYWHCVFIRCVGGYIIVYMSYHDTAIVGIIYYCTRIGVSVLRTGRGRAGGGGGGGVEFLTEKKKFAKKCSWGLKTQKNAKKRVFFPTKFCFSKMFLGFWNACKQKFIFRGGGGGFWGVWGAPRPHPGVARGQKTIHCPVKILERSGLAVKSYHPETLAAEE